MKQKHEGMGRQSRYKKRYVRGCKKAFVKGIIGFGIIGILYMVSLKMTVYAEEMTSENETVQESLTEEELLQIQSETEKKLLEGFDFSKIDESLRKLFPEQKISFREVTETFLEGNMEAAWQMLVRYVSDQIAYEFRNNRQNLVSMLLLAIVAAVFTNFSDALKNKQVSQISFYVLYMLLITLCLNTFRVAMEGLEGRLELLTDFMRVLCPGYLLAVTFASGSSSSLMFYQMVLFLIYLVETLILRFLLPVVNVYIMVQVMNYMLGEEVLSELGEFLKKLVIWSLKTLFGIVVGINVIQGLLAPVMDTLKRSTVTKAVEAIPGIGNTFGSMTDVVLGTAVLIKNGIGAAGAVLILLVCAAPVVQMMLLTLFYKLAAALVQPVSDKRITGCISSVSRGYELLLKVLCTVIVLFLLTLAVIAASTS